MAGEIYKDDMQFAGIFCDVDGCLSEGWTSTIDAKKLSVLQTYHVNSYLNTGTPRISLCTEQALNYAVGIAQMISSREAVICENGAIIYQSAIEAVRFNPAITGDDRKEIYCLTQQLMGEVEVGGSAIIELGRICSVRLRPKIDPRELSRERFQEWVTLMRKQVVPLLSKRMQISTNDQSLDIQIIGVNKRSGAEVASHLIGFPLTNFMGIGDGSNDVELLENVGLAGCPANADDSVKGACEVVSEKRDIDGTLDVIEQLLQLAVSMHE